jgi:hypothetical protein
MKKITSLLIVCSLALAGAVTAQEPTPEASQAPGKNRGPKKEQSTPKGPKTETPATNAPATTNEVPPPPKVDKKAKGPSKQNVSPAATPNLKTQVENPATTPAMTPPTTKADKKNRKNATPATTPSTDAATTAPATSATPDMTKGNKKDKKAPAATASTTPAATTSTTPAATMTPASTPKTAATSSPAAATTASTTPAAGATMTPATSPAASAAPSVSTTTTNTATTKKIEPTKIQQIRQQHATFTAQPRPDRVPPVTFSAGFRLPGVEMWTGPQYEVYRSYHPERHDRNWYQSHHQRVELVAGGYYYFNNGYWYPAWGYDSAHEYYAYDAPIYVGKRSEPPDKVIADVQAALQEMGYYKGEVDGLIGPLTREALTGYQRDNSMQVTAVIDEPTLDSLGMG